jgi:hypothetical protein
MKKQENTSTRTELQEPSRENPPKQPYEPPKATFVPLKVEERLLGCTNGQFTGCGGGVDRFS